jgi:hypothetical protein
MPSYLANAQINPSKPTCSRLTAAERQEFQIGVAMLSMSADAALRMSHNDLLEAGEELIEYNLIVPEAETLTDYTRAQGRPAASRTTPAGARCHVWDDIQFRTLSPKGTLYMMEFDGIRASAYTGGW